MRSAWLLAALLAPLSGFARDCQPAPLQGRELFLRGTMNNWAALDEHQFRWACDRYELVATLEGEHSFKIADEDWSADADWGGRAEALALKGAALQRRFEPGTYCLTLSRAPALEIAACAGRQPSAGQPEPPPPAAASLYFDSRRLEFKKPYGAIAEHQAVDFHLQAAAGVKDATLVIERRRLEGNQEQLDYLPVARVAMRRDARGFHARYRFGSKAIYGYYFEVRAADGRTYV